MPEDNSIPQVIITLDAAKAVIAAQCATASVPELDDTEVEAILARHKMVTIWVAETAYKLGDKIIPTEANRFGRRFRCVGSGTSGADEPTWSDVQGWTHSTNVGAFLGNEGSQTVVLFDGDAQWIDDGPETDLWNLDDACYDAWMQKAGKALDVVTMNRGGNNYNLGDIHQRCVNMAARFGGVFIK